MPIEVTMPKLSPTMETGLIAQWLVKVGDQVKEGDVLAEIETDKATMPMKSYDDGTVAHLDHAAGDEVALGQRVLVLATKGEDPQQVAATLGGGPSQSAGGQKPAQAGAPASPPQAATAATTPDRDEAAASPTKPIPAADRRPDRAVGDGQQTSSGNGQQTAEKEGDQDQESATRRVKISPLARKLAESSHVDLARVQGSGPGGRIIRRDIEAF